MSKEESPDGELTGTGNDTGNGTANVTENGTGNGKVSDGNRERRQSMESDDSETSISNLIPTPPDGGWGWVIVISSLVCNIIVDGIGYSFGIFLPEFVSYFSETRSKVSLIGSLLCGTYLCAGKLARIYVRIVHQILYHIYMYNIYLNMHIYA